MSSAARENRRRRRRRVAAGQRSRHRGAQDGAGRVLQRTELLGRLGAELDEQRGGGRRQLLPLLRRAGHVVAGSDQRRGHHQLGGGGARGDELADGARGGVEILEADEGQRGVAPQRHRVEHRLGHEGQRALGADDQPPEDLQRRVGVQERAQAISGGVLDLELAGDPLSQLGVGTDAVADARQAGGQLRRGGGELLLGAGVCGVDHGAVGQHQGHRAHRAVGVGDDAAAHPTRVVGDHAADAGDVGGGGVGPDAPAVTGEQAVAVAEDHARLRPQARSLILDAHPPPMAADVDEDRVGLALAVEARAAGAKRHGHAELGGAAQELGHVLHVAGDGHRLRDQPVGAGIGGVADEVSARVRTRSAPSAATNRERSGSGVPAATQSGARSGAGSGEGAAAATTPATSRRRPGPGSPAGRRRRRSTRAAPRSAPRAR